MIHAFVLMDIEPAHIPEVAASAAEVPGVQSAHSVAGSEADVVVVVAVTTHDDIAKVVTEHLSVLPGIKATRTLIAFRSYSAEELDAAFEGFGD